MLRGSMAVRALLSAGMLPFAFACGSPGESADSGHWGSDCTAPSAADVAASPGADLGCESETSLAAPVSRAGFIDIEGVDYELRGQPGHSEPARLFYSFIAAEADSREKPLFVFFNGGPGASTMGILHAFGTGPTTVATDPPSAEILDNPASFHQLGNLLYIDARGTGFSYGISDTPTDLAARQRALGPESLNVWVDAADFIRVVLRVLSFEPALRNNRVVLIGESYGASRAALMRSMLFAPQRLSTGTAPEELSPYTDASLAAEIAGHFKAVFPGVSSQRVDPRVVALQFGSQVLIQPAFVFASSRRLVEPRSSMVDCSGGAAMRRAADASGSECPLQFGTFDIDHYGKPDGWVDALKVAAATSMLDPAGFERRFLVPAASVEGLQATQRSRAVRVVNDYECESGFESTRWIEQLGSLPSGDCYFINLLMSGERSRDDNVLLIGLRLLLQQLPWVETLITDAVFDPELPSRAMIEVIDELRASSSVDATASYDGSVHAGEQRPGWVTVNYGPDSGVPEDRRSVRLRMPLYERSWHAVTTNEGAELRADVEAFLLRPQAPTPLE